MTIRLDALQEICSLAGRQLRDLYPDTQSIFIPHAAGSFHEVVSVGEYEVVKHPAGKIATTILERNNHREQSSFLGLAVDHEVKWFGFASTDNILALFNINTDEFSSHKEARHTIYHLIWHAIDLIEIRQKPEYASKFRAGPMIPKRSPMNLSRLNLQADIFAAVMCGLQGEENAIQALARSRAKDSVRPLYARRAEDYPFVIAMEAAQYAFEELLTHQPQRNKYLHYARQLALEVGHAFNDASIRQWWSFSEPAQNMAWQDYAPELILGCAVHTSPDTYVRATGHLVSDAAAIEPAPGLDLAGSYNAFIHSEQNRILHREMMERAFEDAVARGLMEESGQPLLTAANEQNESLADGRIVGWCAAALQAAARAFENALVNGIAPDQAARLEFAGTKDTADWDTLKKISDNIVDQKRKGFGVTMGSVAEICNNDKAFSPLLNSIKATMNDPAYIKKLEMANDLILSSSPPRVSGPAPSAPAVKGPAPNVPSAPAILPMPMPGPGMGGGGMSAHRRMLIEQQRMKAQQQTTTTGQEETEQ